MDQIYKIVKYTFHGPKLVRSVTDNHNNEQKVYLSHKNAYVLVQIAQK